MGATGAGKTTVCVPCVDMFSRSHPFAHQFVNLVAGSSLVVGSGLESLTDTVQVASCDIQGCNVQLIDTPGFNDTYKRSAITMCTEEFLTSIFLVIRRF